MGEFDVIVIGSGAGGLAATAAVARAGLSVLVLEASSEFGGYINAFKRRGYTFDTGLHYLGQLGEGQDFHRMLEGLGAADKVEFVELNPEGFDKHVFADQGYEFNVPKGKERLRERLAADFPREKVAIDKFMKTLEDAENFSKLMGRFSLKKIFQALPAMPRMIRCLRTTYGKLLDGLTKDPLLKAVLSCNWNTCGLPPKYASAFMMLMIWSHYMNGGYYPKGGSRAFKDALIEAAKEREAKLKNRCRVKIIRKRNSSFEVETETEELFSARAVISNADPLITYTELCEPEMVPKALSLKAKSMKYSAGVLYAFAGTDIDLKACGLTDANLSHHETMNPDAEYEEAMKGESADVPRSFFCTSTTLKDPQGKHAPDGKHTLEVITYAKFEPFKRWADKPSMKRGDDYEELKKRLGFELLKQVERYVPELTKHLDVVEFATPLSNLYWVNAPFGASYGPDHTPNQIGPGRFSVSSPIKGLFLCGAGTIGCGVATCVASGYAAGKKVIKYLGKRT